MIKLTQHAHACDIEEFPLGIEGADTHVPRENWPRVTSNDPKIMWLKLITNSQFSVTGVILSIAHLARPRIPPPTQKGK